MLLRLVINTSVANTITAVLNAAPAATGKAMHVEPKLVGSQCARVLLAGAECKATVTGEETMTSSALSMRQPIMAVADWAAIVGRREPLHAVALTHEPNGNRNCPVLVSRAGAAFPRHSCSARPSA